MVKTYAVSGNLKITLRFFFIGFLLQDSKKVLINEQECVTRSLRQSRFSTKQKVHKTFVLV